MLLSKNGNPQPCHSGIARSSFQPCSLPCHKARQQGRTTLHIEGLGRGRSTSHTSNSQRVRMGNSTRLYSASLKSAASCRRFAKGSSRCMCISMCTAASKAGLPAWGFGESDLPDKHREETMPFSGQPGKPGTGLGITPYGGASAAESVEALWPHTSPHFPFQPGMKVASHARHQGQEQHTAPNAGVKCGSSWMRRVPISPQACTPCTI
jgi:hypothetical protein